MCAHYIQNRDLQGTFNMSEIKGKKTTFPSVHILNSPLEMFWFPLIAIHPEVLDQGLCEIYFKVSAALNRKKSTCSNYYHSKQ